MSCHQTVYLYLKEHCTKKQTGMTQKRRALKHCKCNSGKWDNKSQLQNLFNIIDEGDISSVFESVKASGCTTPIADNS